MLQENDRYVAVYNDIDENYAVCRAISKDINTIYKDIIDRVRKQIDHVPIRIAWYHVNNDVEIFSFNKFDVYLERKFDLCLARMIEYRPMCIDILDNDTEVDYCNTFYEIQIVKELD